MAIIERWPLLRVATQRGTTVWDSNQAMTFESSYITKYPSGQICS